MDTPTLHVTYDGQGFDLDMNSLDVGILSTDIQVKEAVARHFSVPVEKFRNYALDKNASTGALTLRPEAVFGSTETLVSVTVKESHMDLILTVTERLRGAGLVVRDVMPAIGVIVGQIEELRIHVLQELAGVLSVEREEDNSESETVSMMPLSGTFD